MMAMGCRDCEGQMNINILTLATRSFLQHQEITRVVYFQQSYEIQYSHLYHYTGVF